MIQLIALIREHLGSGRIGVDDYVECEVCALGLHAEHGRR